MPVSTSPVVAERPPWENETPLRGTLATLTANATNTATTATQVTGLTTSAFVIPSKTTALLVFLQADNVSNSGAVNTILTLWSGVVGTGTQVGAFTHGGQSGVTAAVSDVFYVPVTSSMIGTSVTYNIGMHGSGAGTNTLVAGATDPCNLFVLAI